MRKKRNNLLMERDDKGMKIGKVNKVGKGREEREEAWIGKAEYGRRIEQGIESIKRDRREGEDDRDTG